MSSAWSICWLLLICNQCSVAYTWSVRQCYDSCACPVPEHPVQLCLYRISKGMQHSLMAIDRWVRPETMWSLASTSLCKPRSTRRTRASGCAVGWSLSSSSLLSLLWWLSDHGDMFTISQPYARWGPLLAMHCSCFACCLYHAGCQFGLLQLSYLCMVDVSKQLSMVDVSKQVSTVDVSNQLSMADVSKPKFTSDC